MWTGSGIYKKGEATHNPDDFNSGRTAFGGWTRSLDIALAQLILVIILSAAVAAESENAPRVYDLLEVAEGRRQLVVSVERERVSMPRQRAGGADGEEWAEVVAMIERTMTPEALDGVLRGEVPRRAEPGRVETVLAWFRSPLGSRIVGVEVARATGMDGQSWRGGTPRCRASRER